MSAAAAAVFQAGRSCRIGGRFSQSKLLHSIVSSQPMHSASAGSQQCREMSSSSTSSSSGSPVQNGERADIDSSAASEARPPVVFVVGAGDATGAAVARRFARDGFTACVSRRPRHAAQLQDLTESIRSAGHRAESVPLDARKPDDVVAAVDRIERDVGPIEIAVFNIGANVKFDTVDTTPRVFMKVWEMACFAGFLVGKECGQRMKQRGHGTIIFTGATASVQSNPGFSAFSSAKHGLRAVAGSLARELAPDGIHVCHVLIDGMIDTAFVRDNFPAVYADRKPRQGILSPDSIAEQYAALHRQPKDAWTFEMDLRPWVAKW
eukprot:scpid84022/ scgid0070/ Dehydrogenase/reductase SDR family member 4; NADPH-dependent carbonyl reductase/NADP-retinol dehydrogenase; NADPH-dependent retinol dehydrogenase/reductase; Peroxisomal short-chain alcohol dehydrogenase; SCAD-SRL; Short-chain dehydrogenase/reductase family member 4